MPEKFHEAKAKQIIILIPKYSTKALISDYLERARTLNAALEEKEE